MYEPTIEADIIEKLEDARGEISEPYEVVKYYGASTPENVYMQAEAKLSRNSAFMVRVSNEDKIAGSTGARYYQVVYTIDVVVVGFNLKSKRNSKEPRIVYELKPIAIKNLGGKTVTLNDTKRGYEYVSGSNISLDDKVDLYLLTFNVKAQYTL